MQNYVKDMNYQSLDKEIKRTMRRSAKDAVMLGCMLRRMMTAKLWEECYDCFDDYLQNELHMDYTMANRFIGINKKYSFGGESMDIDEKWENYSQAVLIEMLSMPPELEEKITPDMTVRQVREVKRQARQEKAEELESTEKVATSQTKQSPYGLAKSEYPEGSLIAAAGCGNKYNCFSCAQNCGIRQESRYCTTAPLGNPFSCTTMEVLENLKTEGGDRCQFLNNDLAPHRVGDGEAVPCCMDCKEFCGYRCRRSSQGEGIMDAEYRELEAVEEVATSQCPELVKPNKEQSRRLDDFAKYFISCEHDWLLADFDNRVQNVDKSPEEIKAHLGMNLRTWYFQSGSGVGHINLFEEYVQLWDETGTSAINVDWFYLARAIQLMWNAVALDVLAEDPAAEKSLGSENEPHDDVDSESEESQQQFDELAEIRRILQKEQKKLHEYLEVGDLPAATMFKQKTIVAALAAMVCDLGNEQPEAEAQEKAVVQPELPKFKNNNQRKDWLNSYKSWGLWYLDDNIGVEYYKYDFDNGARLIAEVYHVGFQAWTAKYCDAYETCFLHLVGGPEPPKGQYGIGKWTRNEKYSRHPNSETELVEFLKELQKK